MLLGSDPSLDVVDSELRPQIAVVWAKVSATVASVMSRTASAFARAIWWTRSRFAIATAAKASAPAIVLSRVSAAAAIESEPCCSPAPMIAPSRHSFALVGGPLGGRCNGGVGGPSRPRKGPQPAR